VGSKNIDDFYQNSYKKEKLHNFQSKIELKVILCEVLLK